MSVQPFDSLASSEPCELGLPNKGSSIATPQSDQGTARCNQLNDPPLNSQQVRSWTSFRNVFARVGKTKGGLNSNDRLGTVLSRAREQKINAALFVKIATGSERAFAEIYDRLSPQMFGLAWRITRSATEAEVVLLEAFKRVWQQATTYSEHSGTVFGWVTAIVRDAAIDRISAGILHATRLEAASSLREKAPPLTPIPLDKLTGGEGSLSIHSALLGIRVKDRQLLELVFFDGLSHGEIASALGLPIGTVRAQIWRGLLQLRKSAYGVTTL